MSEKYYAIREQPLRNIINEYKQILRNNLMNKKYYLIYSIAEKYIFNHGKDEIILTKHRSKYYYVHLVISEYDGYTFNDLVTKYNILYNADITGKSFQLEMNILNEYKQTLRENKINNLINE